MAIKNQALVVSYQAWNTSTGLPAPNDVANHAVRVRGDGTKFTPVATPSADTSDFPAVYTVALTAAEMNYNAVIVGGTSSTANVVLVPTPITTERGEVAAMYAGQLEMGLIPCAGTVTSASGTSVVVNISVNAPTALSTLVGQQLFLASGDRPTITAASGTASAAALTLDAAPATSPAGGSAFTIL